MYSAAAGCILPRRSSSRSASFLTSSGMPAASILSRSSVVLALLVVALAQLLLDRLDLLAQVVLALALLQLVLHLVLDLAAHLEHLEVAQQGLVHLAKPLADVEHFEDFLLLHGVERLQAAGDEVGEAARLLDVAAHVRQLLGERRRQRHHALEEALRVLRERAHFHFLVGRNALDHRLDDRLDVGAVLRHARDAEAVDALHHQPQRAVGKLEQLVDVGECADAVQVGLDGVVHGGVSLRDHADDLAFLAGLVHERDRTLARHRQRQHRVREQYGVAQRQQPDFGGQLARFHFFRGDGLARQLVLDLVGQSQSPKKVRLDGRAAGTGAKDRVGSSAPPESAPPARRGCATRAAPRRSIPRLPGSARTVSRTALP